MLFHAGGHAHAPAELTDYKFRLRLILKQKQFYILKTFKISATHFYTPPQSTCGSTSGRKPATLRAT